MTAQLLNAEWDAYIAERRWSNSSLGHLLPGGFGARHAWLLHNGKARDVSTDAQVRGAMVHALVFEGADAFAERFEVVARRTEKVVAAAREAGKTVVNETQHRGARAATNALLRAVDERAKDGDTSLGDLLAAPGLQEQSFVWEDEETGLPLKGRADKLIPEARTIVDLTTSRDWEPEWRGWLKHAYYIGKHRQAWMYLSAMQAIYGGEWQRQEIVVHVETGRVGVYRFGSVHLDLARDEARRAMVRAQELAADGRWIDEAERGVIDLPAFPEFIYQNNELQVDNEPITMGGKAIV